MYSAVLKINFLIERKLKREVTLTTNFYYWDFEKKKKRKPLNVS